MKDLTAYRDEFPVTRRTIYLNHASVSPLPLRSCRAMQRLAGDVCEYGSAHYASWVENIAALRAAAASLIGSAPEEIAVTKNTSEGLSFVANGLDWRPGDVAVGVRGEFPANYFPWLRLANRGVEVRWLELRDGRVDLDQLEEACRGARLLSISYVQYISGFRADLDVIGEICRRHGVLFVVDAVQGLGGFPVDVKRSGIHALAASAHKWLLGPEGCGILFIDRELIPRVEPVEFGWTNVEGWRTYSLDSSLRPGAGRYECGTLNTIGVHGFRQSLELFLEAGPGRIAERIHSLVERLIEGAQAKGYELMTPRSRRDGSGIVSLRKPGLDSAEVVKGLAEQGIAASPRCGWVRFAPHFYITEEEIGRAVELLP